MLRLKNGAELWKRVQKAGLAVKRIDQFSLEQLLTFAVILVDHIEGDPRFENLFKVFPGAKPITIERQKNEKEKNQNRKA